MNTLNVFVRSLWLKYSQELKRPRSFFMGIFFAAAPLIFLTAVLKWGEVTDVEDFAVGYFLFLYGGMSVLFFSIVMGIGLYQREVDGGTVPYMLEVPLKRYQIHFSRYISTVMFQMTFVVPSLLISHLALLKWWGDKIGEGGGLPLLLIMTIGGIFAYTAIFTLLSLTIPKPLLVSFMYGLFWEYLVGISTLRMKSLTVMYYLKSLTIRSIMKGGTYIGGEKLAGAADSSYALILASVVFLLLGAIVLSVKNFEKI